MKVWVFVEGESDRLALEALWARWKSQLRQAGWGLQIVPMGNKTRFLTKIGPRAAEKLVANCDDVVVGLPDLYPNQPYRGTPFEHTDLSALEAVQKRLVQNALRKVYGHSRPTDFMERFLPSALKHDLEMLLLAAREPLRKRLKTRERLGSWRKPPEDQNQGRPPKRVVEQLFIRKLRRGYRDTTDAPAILRETTLRDILFDEQGNVQCPTFKSVVDWIGKRTGVEGYSNTEQ